MSLRAAGEIRAARENNVAAGEDPNAGDAQKTLLDRVRTLVPTEAVTAYVALIGVTSALDVWWRIIALLVVAVAVPWWVYFNYWQKATDDAKRNVRFPIFDASVGLVAFLAWSATVPLSPWDDIKGFTPAIGLAVVVGVSVALGVAQQVHEVWLSRRTPTPPTPDPPPQPAPPAPAG